MKLFPFLGSRHVRQSARPVQALATVLAMCLLVLSACGGRSDDDSSSGGAALSVGGTVSGLAANNPVVLVNNADTSTALTLTTNGPFAFTQSYAAGAAYNVTVRTQPAAQICTVQNGSGMLQATPTATTTATPNLTVTCVGMGKLAAGTAFATVAGPSLPASVNVSTIAGIAGQTTHNFTPGLARISTFNGPYMAASDGTYLYVTEVLANAIRQIRLSDNFTSNFLDGGLAGGFADDMTGKGGARFNGLTGIATDGKHLYVGDVYNCAIRRIEIATKIVSTVVGQGGSCRSGTSYVDGQGTSIKLGGSKFPTGDNNKDIINLQALALSDDGKFLYFGDLNLLRKLDLATGMVSTVLGKLGDNGGSGNLDGSFGDAFIATIIQGIAIHGSNLYMLTGTLNHTLRKVDLAAQTVSTLELFYADGSITPGIFNTDNKQFLASVQKANPQFKPFDTGYGLGLSRAIATDGTYLYVAALASNQVVRIHVDGRDNGIPTSMVKPSLVPSYADGPGTVATFHYPTGIISDGQNLYVVEYLNFTVRKISPN